MAGNRTEKAKPQMPPRKAGRPPLTHCAKSTSPPFSRQYESHRCYDHDSRVSNAFQRFPGSPHGGEASLLGHQPVVSNAFRRFPGSPPDWYIYFAGQTGQSSMPFGVSPVHHAIDRDITGWKCESPMPFGVSPVDHARTPCGHTRWSSRLQCLSAFPRFTAPNYWVMPVFKGVTSPLPFGDSSVHHDRTHHRYHAPRQDVSNAFRRFPVHHRQDRFGALSRYGRLQCLSAFPLFTTGDMRDRRDQIPAVSNAFRRFPYSPRQPEKLSRSA